LIVAIFVIWDTVSKIVESQRNYIGVMSALGGNKWRIVFHYVGYALVLGLIASGIGVIFSFLLAEVFMEAYRGVLKMPIADRDITGALPYFGIAIGIALGLTALVSFLSALRAASITPREAMSSAYVQHVYSDKPMLERVFTKVPGFKSLAIRIPLRSILRNKRRSFLTFLTYGISMLIVFGSLGFVESFLYQLDYYYNDLEKQDIAVYMLDPMDDAGLSSQLENLGNITQADPFVNGVVQISHSRSIRSTEIYGYSDTDLRSFNTKKGKSIEPGFIYLGSILAKRLGANIGSSVEIQNETFRVGDILQELMDQNAVMHFETAQKLFGLENLATGALVKVSGDVDDAKKEILTSGLPVSFLLVKSEIHSSIVHLMEGVMSIFIVVILLGFAVLALFSFNTVVMDVMSRELEFVNFRTLGSKKRTLYKVIGTQGAAIALLGTLIGIPIGYLGIAQFNTIVEDVMYVQTYISPLSILVTVIVGLLASQVGIWAAVRHVNGLNLVDVTRNRVNT
ncbi:MAG: ABC transporter permease, partial [Candidatus Hodarchaeales archaeon]